MEASAGLQIVQTGALHRLLDLGARRLAGFRQRQAHLFGVHWPSSDTAYFTGAGLVSQNRASCSGISRS